MSYCRTVLPHLKKRKYCRSAEWLSFSNRPCSHCMRLVVEGLTVDGQRLKDEEEPVNYALERELIFEYYPGKRVLNKIMFLEDRVLYSLGFPSLL